MTENPRRLALEVLNQEDAYANIALDKALSESRLSELDRNFVTALVYGTIAKKILLIHYLSPYLKKKTKPWVQTLLVLTAYQILYMDRVPTSAATDEAVKLAKQIGGPQVAAFVNAVLRNFSRNALLPPKDFGTKYSLPDFIVQKFIGQFGKERAVRIFESLETPSSVSIRVVNGVSIQVPNLRPSELSPVGLVAASGNIAASPDFKAGKITLQDETSQLVALVLDARPGDQVLDACAAPGGKTCQIAETASVTALDLYDHKLKLIEQNAKRLHVADKIKTLKVDASEVDRHFAPKTFDKILVDAPCSGLGLLRRKPDLKYRKKTEDFAALQRIQLAILHSVSKVLKENGIIVYSTCTLADEENFEVIKKFLESHSEFKQVSLIHEKANIMREGCLYITPELYHTDGFFIAKFIKK